MEYLRKIPGWGWMLVLIIAAFFAGIRVAPAITQQGECLVAWVAVIIQFAIPGAVGGLLTLLSQFNPKDVLTGKEDIAPTANYKNVWLAGFLSVMGGVGGAGAAMYFMNVSSKLKVPSNDLELLENCSVGFVSGFLGFAFLRQISNSFANWAKIKDEATEAAAKAAQAKIDQFAAMMEPRLELDDCLRRAQDVRRRVREGKLHSGDTDFVDALRQLETARKPCLDHRSAAIVLANMYYDQKNYKKSVEVVSETIAVLEPQASAGNEKIRKITVTNIADLLFNRACYQAKLIKDEQDPTRKAALLQALINDLARSFDLSPKNAEEADTDKDFADIKEDKDFKALILKYKKPTPTS
jgi:hypothetical protein